MEISTFLLPFPFLHKSLQRIHHSAVEFQGHPFGLRNRNIAVVLPIVIAAKGSNHVTK